MIATVVELVRSNDLVHLSWAQAMLGGAAIPCLLADVHVSAVEGSIGILPRRLLVLEEDLERARAVLEAAAGARCDGDSDGAAAADPD
jgi:hypothetical protein